MDSDKKPMTPDEFMGHLRDKFEIHLEAVRQGAAEPYSFLRHRQVSYNDWLDHHHGWPITDDLLCGPSLASVCCYEHNDGAETPFEECDTCSKLVQMYREHCSERRTERDHRRWRQQED